MPERNRRVLVHAETYLSSDINMRFRTLDSQFVEVSSEVTEWVYTKGLHEFMLNTSEILPDANRKVIVYPPCYKGRVHNMLYRIIDSEFVELNKDVAKWQYVETLWNLRA